MKNVADSSALVTWTSKNRGVAQLVEHYLREVGAACSNHVTPIALKAAF